MLNILALQRKMPLDCNTSNLLLNLLDYYFVKIFSIYVHLGCWIIFYFSYVFDFFINEYIIDDGLPF